MTANVVGIGAAAAGSRYTVRSWDAPWPQVEQWRRALSVFQARGAYDVEAHAVVLPHVRR
jgi:hypothetical protein